MASKMYYTVTTVVGNDYRAIQGETRRGPPIRVGSRRRMPTGSMSVLIYRKYACQSTHTSYIQEMDAYAFFSPTEPLVPSSFSVETV